MKAYTLDNDNRNKLKTKEELLEYLRKYQNILAKPILDYLNSLIELEFSVIKELIKSDDRILLSELDIYNQIAIYNIYQRTLNLFNRLNNDFIITRNNVNQQELHIAYKVGNKPVSLFDFDYGRKESIISIFQISESIEFKEQELNHAKYLLKKLQEKRELYNKNCEIEVDEDYELEDEDEEQVVGGPALDWSYANYLAIQKCKNQIKKLEKKLVLTDDDKKIIEITQEIHNLLLENFGLTVNDLKKTVCNHELWQIKRIRKIPNIIIKDCTQYL